MGFFSGLAKLFRELFTDNKQPMLCRYCGTPTIARVHYVARPVPSGAKDLGLTDMMVTPTCPGCEWKGESGMYTYIKADGDPMYCWPDY